MSQYLENADKFFYLRKERFHERYLDDVSALVNSVTVEVIRKQDRVSSKILLNCVLDLERSRNQRQALVLKTECFRGK